VEFTHDEVLSLSDNPPLPTCLLITHKLRSSLIQYTIRKIEWTFAQNSKNCACQAWCHDTMLQVLSGEPGDSQGLPMCKEEQNCRPLEL
jgi:hypothetical protein